MVLKCLQIVQNVALTRTYDIIECRNPTLLPRKHLQRSLNCLNSSLMSCNVPKCLYITFDNAYSRSKAPKLSHHSLIVPLSAPLIFFHLSIMVPHPFAICYDIMPPPRMSHPLISQPSRMPTHRLEAMLTHLKSLQLNSNRPNPVSNVSHSSQRCSNCPSFLPIN